MKMTKVDIIVFLIAIINIISIIFIGDFIWNLEIKIKIITISFIFIIEIFMTLYAIKSFYQKPIVELELAIKKFLTGKYKDEKIELKKTQNKDLDYIISFFNNTIKTLKNIKEEFLHGKEIKGEVSLAKEIQGKTFTKKLKEIPSLNVIAKSKPAGEIGGDSYDIIQNKDNYYIYVGDATGHGVGAGLIMMMVNALVSGFSKVFEKGNDILIKTNEILKPRVKANLLMTVLLLRWNEKTKKMYFTGAGHEYLMIYKHKKQKCFKIKSGGLALGMVKDSSKLTKEQRISFEPNDIIVLYSDGITEAINRPSRNGTETMFGEDRLMKVIENAPNVKGTKHKSAASIFNNITIQLSRFMGYKPIQLDDITLATIEYKGPDNETIQDYPLDIPEEFITEWRWK